MCFNADETGMNLMPAGKSGWSVKGSDEVSITIFLMYSVIIHPESEQSTQNWKNHE